MPIALGLFFLGGCTSATHVSRRYTHVFAEIAGEELIFSRTGKFEYYTTTERGVRGYSSGAWQQAKRVIFLNGFDDKNINALNVESRVEAYSDRSKDMLVVQYEDDPLDTFIKVDVVVNEGAAIRIPGDTTCFSDAAITTLQIRSYLVHEGILLGNPARIDTLYSSRMEVSNNGRHNKIQLKFSVDLKDFYRIKLTDSLTLKNGRTLRWGKRELRKIRETETSINHP